MQRQKKWLRVCVFGLALLAGVSSAVATLRPAQAISRKWVSPETRAPLFVMRNAPVAPVLMMLLDAYDKDYSIAPDLPGKVTVKATDETYDKMLGAVVQGSSVPITYTHEGVMYFSAGTSADGAKPMPSKMPGESDFPVPQKVTDVPRRVAAVLVMPNYVQAIILDARESKPYRVAVGNKPYRVTVGDTIPAGIAGQEPLTVTRIDDKGVELTQKGNEQAPFRVDLTDNYDSFLKKP